MLGMVASRLLDEFDTKKSPTGDQFVPCELKWDEQSQNMAIWQEFCRDC
jgi:hypothetical protein